MMGMIQRQNVTNQLVIQVASTLGAVHETMSLPPNWKGDGVGLQSSMCKKRRRSHA
jgi:hypothetical protein